MYLGTACPGDLLKLRLTGRAMNLIEQDRADHLFAVGIRASGRGHAGNAGTLSALPSLSRQPEITYPAIHVLRRLPRLLPETPVDSRHRTSAVAEVPALRGGLQCR